MNRQHVTRRELHAGDGPASHGGSRPAPRIPTLLAGAFVAILVSIGTSGCAITPDGRTAAAASPSKTHHRDTPSPSPSPAASLSFAQGTALNPDGVIGWLFSYLPDGDVWIPDPDAAVGDVVFMNVDKTCTAQYWQEFYDTTETDDRIATEKFFTEFTDFPLTTIQRGEFDGHFALTHSPSGAPEKGDVAALSVMVDMDDGGTSLLTERVFTKVDHATAGMNNAYSLELDCTDGTDPGDFVDSLDEVAKINIPN
jgi:hypothetical protein